MLVLSMSGLVEVSLGDVSQGETCTCRDPGWPREPLKEMQVLSGQSVSCKCVSGCELATTGNHC